jgi:hypothetical protein
VIPPQAHLREKCPHMIKLDADNGPGRLIPWETEDARRGAEAPRAKPPAASGGGGAPDEFADGHRISLARELTAAVPRSQESQTRSPDTAEGGDGYRRPIVSEIFHRPALSTGRGGAGTCPDAKKAWARSGAWPPRAQTERARSLGPFADDHAVRFLSNARTQL